MFRDVHILRSSPLKSIFEEGKRVLTNDEKMRTRKFLRKARARMQLQRYRRGAHPRTTPGAARGCGGVLPTWRILLGSSFYFYWRSEQSSGRAACGVIEHKWRSRRAPSVGSVPALPPVPGAPAPSPPAPRPRPVPTPAHLNIRILPYYFVIAVKRTQARRSNWTIHIRIIKYFLD